MLASGEGFNMTDQPEYERRHGLPPRSLLELGNQLQQPESLCWRCSKVQGFFDSPCQHCGAINPNFDLKGALAQQDFASIPVDARKSPAVKDRPT
jgi:hypothetical protein